MTLAGKPYRPRNVTDALNRGVALIPESRRLQGLCLSLPVGTNLNLPSYRRLSAFGLVRTGLEAQNAAAQISSLNVRTPSAARPVGKLSGGNQQKVVVGKWLASEPKVLIIDEPTRGVDVGAKAEIHRLITQLAAERGLAILMISSELPEILGMSDRVLVMRGGRIVDEFTRAEATPEAVGAAMMSGAAA